MATTKLKGYQVDTFTTTDNGVVPAPGTATGKFLRDDGTWAAGGSGSPGGSSGQVQYNNGGSFAGASNVGIQDNELALSAVSNPTTPTNALKLYAVQLANRYLAAIKGTAGIEMILQANLYKNGILSIKSAGNSTTITAIGAASPTATGTATAANVAVTNIHTQIRGIDYLVTVASATAVAGFRANVQQFFRGTTSSEGGFFFVGRWGPATGVATATNRASFGMHANQSAPTDVEPSTIINHISMGWDAADTNIQIMHNSGSGTSTKIDLGTSFPVPTADRTKMYELVLFCQPGGTIVYYEVLDLGTGSKATGSVNTNLPSTTTLMNYKGWMSVGNTSSVIGIKLGSVYIETDN